MAIKVCGMAEHRYRTSRDYHELWRLLQETPVVCVCNYVGGSGYPHRDICATLWSFGTAQLSVRGMCYLCSESESEFVADCERAGVEFFPPTA